MALLDDIEAAKRMAVARVIAGGMREDLQMAQVIAAENVVVANLNEKRLLVFKKSAPAEPEKHQKLPTAEPPKAPPSGE